MPTTSPRVFISYSHDSEPHRQFVAQLSATLRQDGLNCQIDQYINGFPPEGWQRWMENEIVQADFVLLVCTPAYLKRYQRKEHSGGRGASFEGVVVSQLLYDSRYNNAKFIPVIPKTGIYEDVPIGLRQYNIYSIPDQYDELYRFLTTQAEHDVPPIGNRRDLPKKQTVGFTNKTARLVSPSWPQNIEEDKFGKYAEIAVGDIVQVMRWIRPKGTVKTGFWIADTPCTQALWLAVTGSNPSKFKGETQRPVEQVSWFAVQNFLEKLNQQITGLQARLPREDEWELACRGSENRANMIDKSANQGQQVHCSAQATAAVKDLPADHQGLFCMHGNVFEWCEDDFDESGDSKVLRGGSWASSVNQCRWDARAKSRLGNRDYTFGFRFVV